MCHMVSNNKFSFTLFQALEEMAARNEGKVVCTRSKEIFDLDKCDKVYVM